jgi:hypothetical protein
MDTNRETTNFNTPQPPANRPGPVAASGQTASGHVYQGQSGRPVAFDGGQQPTDRTLRDYRAGLPDPSRDRIADPRDSRQTKEKPWGALTMAVFALFASMGGNLYMGWIAVGIYQKYMDLADDLSEEEYRDRDRDLDRRDDRDWSDRGSRRGRATARV